MQSIILIGGRGVGKTTIGRLLARRVGLPFADTDETVECVVGISVTEFFESRGEPAFRAMESAALQQVLTQSPVVVATGGGIVESEANRHVMKQNGLIVWLNASPKIAFDRILNDPFSGQRRPNLTAMERLTEIGVLMEKRRPWYEEIADLTIDTSALSPDGVVSAILAAC